MLGSAAIVGHGVRDAKPSPIVDNAHSDSGDENVVRDAVRLGVDTRCRWLFAGTAAGEDAGRGRDVEAMSGMGLGTCCRAGWPMDSRPGDCGGGRYDPNVPRITI